MICFICGKEFEPKENQTVCSNKCRYEYNSRVYRQVPSTFTCRICGNKFKNVEVSSLCSGECRKEAIRRRTVQDAIDGTYRRDKIDRIIAICRQEGMEYADYQKEQTAQIYARVDVTDERKQP